MEQPNQTVLIYSLFYGHAVPAKSLDLLSGLDRDEILKFLIKLKIAISRINLRNLHHPFIQEVIAVLPSSSRQKLIAFLASDELAYYLTNSDVINSIIADILNNEIPHEGPASQQENLATVLLDLIMIYNEHHFKTINIGSRPDDHALLWELMLMQEINAVNKAAYVRNGIGKQAIFLEFLKYKLSDRFKEFEKRICTKIGVNTLLDVPYQFVTLQVEHDKVARTWNPLLAVLPNNPLYSVFEQLGLVIDTCKKEKHSVEKLVMHCFLRLADDKLYLMGTNDFGLITDKGWQYFLFKQGNLVDYLPEITDFNQFQSYIGLNYIEKYLMSRIFQSLNKPGFRIVLSDDLKTPDVTIIHNEADIFLFEIKSYSMHYKVWKNQDINELKKHIDERYLSDKKGVTQLHKCLANLAGDPQNLFKLFTPLRKVKIYPIIIYTEPHMGSVGINDYIIQQSPVIPDHLLSLFHNVLPVTMIHYDFFLENLEVIQSNKKVLKDAVIRYHRDVKARKAGWNKVKTTYNFQRAMISFDNYSAGFRGLYETNQNNIFASLRKLFMA